MRYRSDIWEKFARRGRFQMEAKAVIDGNTYTAISAPKIDRPLMDSPLSIGNCLSASLNLSVLTEDVIPKSSSVIILARITDGTTYSEWIEFGTFFVDQRDTDYGGLVTLSCYDAMLKANQPYLRTGAAFEWPKPMKTVVEEIAERIGVSIDPRTRINTGDDYYVPRPDNLTLAEVLGYIADCHGGNWIITEENALRLVPLITTPDITYRILDSDYEPIEASDGSLIVYEQQTVFNTALPKQRGEIPNSTIPTTYNITDLNGCPIVTPGGDSLVWARDGSANAMNGSINVPAVLGQITTGAAITVTGVSMSDNDGNEYTAGTKGGGVIVIEGNPYATQQICNSLYSAFAGLVYAPFTATKAIYDPAAELGDQVLIGDKVHSVIYGANMTLDVGFCTDINAPNNEELGSEYPYISDTNSRFTRLTAELNGALSLIDDFSGISSDLNMRVSKLELAEDARPAVKAIPLEDIEKMFE